MNLNINTCQYTRREGGREVSVHTEGGREGGREGGKEGGRGEKEGG